MSGYKYTEFSFQTEREERLALERDLKAMQHEADGLHAQITETLADMSPGLRDTFSAEVAAADDWLALDPPIEPQAGQDIARLRHAHRQAYARGEQGRQALRALALAHTQTAGALGRRLAARHQDARETPMRCAASSTAIASANSTTTGGRSTSNALPRPRTGCAKTSRARTRPSVGSSTCSSSPAPVSPAWPAAPPPSPRACCSSPAPPASARPSSPRSSRNSWIEKAHLKLFDMSAAGTFTPYHPLGAASYGVCL